MFDFCVDSSDGKNKVKILKAKSLGSIERKVSEFTEEHEVKNVNVSMNGHGLYLATITYESGGVDGFTMAFM